MPERMRILGLSSAPAHSTTSSASMTSPAEPRSAVGSSGETPSTSAFGPACSWTPVTRPSVSTSRSTTAPVRTSMAPRSTHGFAYAM